MAEYEREVQKSNEHNRSAWARKALLTAALEGKSLHRPLMIGDMLVENDMTFEAIQTEQISLINEGYIELDSQWRAWTTEKGRQELASE